MQQLKDKEDDEDKGLFIFEDTVQRSGCTRKLVVEGMSLVELFHLTACDGPKNNVSFKDLSQAKCKAMKIGERLKKVVRFSSS